MPKALLIFSDMLRVGERPCGHMVLIAGHHPFQFVGNFCRTLSPHALAGSCNSPPSRSTKMVRVALWPHGVDRRAPPFSVCGELLQDCSATSFTKENKRLYAHPSANRVGEWPCGHIVLIAGHHPFQFLGNFCRTVSPHAWAVVMAVAIATSQESQENI